VLDDPKPLLWGGEPILRAGAIVGYLTSGSFGHTVGSGIGMGYVMAAEGAMVQELTVASEPFEIEIAGRPVAARAFTRAPYDPGHSRMRG
jgi:4-methylaminobutanoate oxidase (formaldehyde-forming)